MTVKSILNRIIDFIALPLLLTVSLDISDLFSCILFGFFSLLTYLSKSFSLTLIRFWQSSAIVASSFWLLHHVVVIDLSLSVLLIIDLVLWFLYCLFGNRFETVFSALNFGLFDRLMLFLFFSFVFFISPRNIVQQFGMLDAEDQENWMYPIADSLNGIKSMFEVPFGSQGVQFFTRFIVSIFGEIGRLGQGDQSRLYFVAAICNAWLFLLVSSIVFLHVLLSMLVKKHLSSARFFALLGTTCIFLLIFFRSSLFFGHLSQFLLTVTIFTFVVSLLFRKVETYRRTLFTDRFASVALAWCFVGSYNPWLPVALIAIFLAVLAEIPSINIGKLSTIRILVTSFLVSASAIFFAFDNVTRRFGGLHDAGGVWPISLLALALFIMFSISILFARFTSSNFEPNLVGSNDKSADLVWSWTLTALIFMFCTLVVSRPSLGDLLELEPSRFSGRVQLMSVMVFFGFFILPSTNRRVAEFFQDKRAKFMLREVQILGTVSLLFVMLVWALSFSTGSGKPMYAAQKSALSLFQQFYWLILVFLFVRSRCLSRWRFAIHLLTVLAALTLGLGLLSLAKQVMLAKPLSVAQGLFDPWWHNEVIAELKKDPEAIVVCLNGDLDKPDYTVYSCNRFLQTLTKHNYPASGFRYLFFHQPEEFQKIQAFFDSSQGIERVVVVTRDDLGDEIMQIFRSVDDQQLVVVKDTQ